MKNCCRVVLTGGPGGGKTTAADLYRREIGSEVVIVPEAATLPYSGGFPRLGDESVRKSTQKAIYNLQMSLEEVYSSHYKSRILLCDRGTLDGVAYWPGPQEEFFEGLHSSLEQERQGYDAVLFFETAAVGGISIEGGNPQRIESLEDALKIDRKLFELWSPHPHFVFIPHQASFIQKVNKGLQELSKIIQQFKI